MKEVRQGNRVIRFDYGEEVKLDIDGDTEVEFEYCRVNDLMYIREKSWYSEKLPRCEGIGVIKERLKLLLHGNSSNGEESAQNGSDKRNGRKPKPDENDLRSPEERELDELAAEADEIIEEEDEAVIKDANGKKDERRSRNAEGIRRSYNAIRKKVEGTAKCEKSTFDTFTLDTYPSFSEMSKVVAEYALYVQRKYDNFKAGFIFLEPSENGEWHAHLIVFWGDDVPATYEKDAKKWWRKRNKKPSEHQVEIRVIRDLDDLEQTLDYVNPLSDKLAKDTEDDEDKTTKRQRLHFYPLWCKPMRCFGEVENSIKGLAKMEDLKKLGLEELDEKRRKYAEVIDDENAVLYSRKEFVFILDESKSVADVDPAPPPKPPKPPICDCFESIAYSCKSNGSCFECLGAMYDNLCPYAWGEAYQN